jgi:hypothetical protein
LHFVCAPASRGFASLRLSSPVVLALNSPKSRIEFTFLVLAIQLSLVSIPEAVAEIQAGHMVIVVDDEDREKRR